MDPTKMKVVDLRHELQQRGLDTKGNKAVLVKRLKDALEKKSKDSTNSSNKKEHTDNSHKEPQDDQSKEKPPEVKTPIKAEPKSPLTQESKSPIKQEVKSPKKESKKQEMEIIDKNVKVEPEELPAVKDDKEEILIKSEPQEALEENGEELKQLQESAQISEKTIKEAKPNVEGKQSDEVETVVSKPGNGKRKREQDSSERELERTSKKLREKTYEPVVIKEDEPDIDYEKVLLSWYDSDLHLQVDKDSFLSAKPLNDGCFGFVWAGARATYGASSGKVCFEVKITEEMDWEDPTKEEVIERKARDKSKYRTDHRKERDKHYKKNSDRKSSQYKSTEKDDEAKSSVSKTNKCEEDNEKTDGNEEKSDKVCEKMETDIEQENQEVQPENVEKEEQKNNEDVGKENETLDTEMCDDKKSETEKIEIDQEKESTDIPKESIPSHYFRVGFSLSESTLQLGEVKHSFAYESSGKFVTDKQFEDYGVKFVVGDVIGAYLSIDNEQVTITYTVNGILQPTAITVPRSEFPQENFALFPHVLSKNYACELNFGNRSEPWFPHPEEMNNYEFVQNIDNKIAGPKRPETRSECELILMVGLSGSGKTHWVKKYVESTKDRTYTIIGNDSIFSRMTVDGQPFKSRFTGAWRILVDKLQKCLNTLTNIAALRRRNFIIDQTNVFPQAQNRKLRAFEGFKRKAVCLICNDEEHTRRQKQQDNDYGKCIPESSLLEQKGQIELPRNFDGLELIFPDLNEEESKKMIKKYREEVREKGYYRRSYVNRRDNRRGYHSQNNYRERNYGRYNKYSQGGWSRSSGNWNRDRRNSQGSSYGGGSSWRPHHSRESSSDDHNRSRDVSRSNTNYGGARNQSGRSSGSWQSSGGNNWNSGSNQGGWNQQMFGSHGYGAWTRNQQGWKYNGNQGNYSGGNNSGYGHQDWNYYDGYNNQQGWGSQRRK